MGADIYADGLIVKGSTSGGRSARTVIAVNRDPDAFIFGLAHFGIVDDVAKALPKLTEAIAGAVEP